MRIRSRAKACAEDGDSTLSRWWANKYKRPPNDPLYRRRTLASLVQEMFEDLYVSRTAVLDALQRASGTRANDLQEQLAAINRALAEPSKLGDGPMLTGDAVVDEWEEQLARGEMPDFEKHTRSGKTR